MSQLNKTRYRWRRGILLRVLPVLMILLFAGIVKGQVYMHDSLAAYLEQATRNNPTVQAKFNEYLAALEKVPQAGGLPDPEFSFGVFVKPMELLGGNQVADFQLMQMFPWFGTLHSARDEASLMAKAKFESFRNAKQELFFDVRKAWLELYLNQARISVTQKNLELLKAIERIALIRFSSSTPGASELGTNQMGSSSDLISLYRIQIEMGDLENRLADWKTQQTVLTATFNSLLNRTSGTPVSLPDTLIPEIPGGSFLAIRDSIWSNNTMLSMLAAEKQAYDERIRMSKRMSYPMFGLGIDYMLINPRAGNTSMMNGKDMIMPMGKITLPIYRGKYSALRKEAEFMSLATVNQISAMQNSLTVDYHNVLKMQNDATRRIRLYSRQSDLAQKTLNLMIVEFSVSGTGLDELLKIEQQLLDYELLKISAIVENNIAIAGLDRLMASAGGAQTE
ncbi:MAG: TolC family protein [Bacteroidales bacterium]|nr:TolC family protein [Bacteroidales bacterium]